MEITCYKCKKTLQFDDGHKITRSEDCDHCGYDLHSCTMCTFYSKSSYNECSEPVALRVSDKEKANFCDYFKVSTKNSASEADKAADYLAIAKSLFKN
ncbi:MAG: hypothetical protein U0T83_00040 [Bacteriovoracaceae bacterium]